MTTDALQGLSGTLKEKAKTTKKIVSEAHLVWKKTTGQDKAEHLAYQNRLWLPLEAVKEEMASFKLWVQNELAKELNKEMNSVEVDEVLEKLIVKVEEVMK